MNTLQDRLESAVRSIMSGNNHCGTLANAAMQGDADYFRKMIAPSFGVYEREAEELRQQRNAALRDSESMRFALESIVQNMGVCKDGVCPDPNQYGAVINNLTILDAIRKALPGHPNLS